MQIPAESLRTVCTTVYFPQRLRIRSEKTRREYFLAIRDWRKSLGREPTLDDLNDTSLLAYMRAMIDRSLAPKTINERRGRICTLWTWLAKRGIVPTWPTVEKIPEAERTPRAWDRDELDRLFAACTAQRGQIAGIAAGQWWLALHAVAWNTSERKGAMLAIEWAWVDLRKGELRIPANARKGQRKPAFYRLWPETVALLASIREPKRKLVFPWPYNEATLYNRYKRIRERAGLSIDRWSAFQRMRVSHASWLKAAGGNPTQSLGHDSESTTRRHYIDPAIGDGENPRLFFPHAS